jgi:hypothetical protein
VACGIFDSALMEWLQIPRSIISITWLQRKDQKQSRQCRKTKVMGPFHHVRAYSDRQLLATRYKRVIYTVPPFRARSFGPITVHLVFWIRRMSTEIPLPLRMRGRAWPTLGRWFRSSRRGYCEIHWVVSAAA